MQSKDCVAVAAAMVTGTEPEDFIAWARSYAFDPRPDCNRGYEDVHLCAYLALHGFLCGYIFEVKYPVQGDNLACDVRLNLDGQPAYIAVEVVDGWDHAIIWDGAKVLDPSPGTPNWQPLSHYKIKRIIPIYKWGK
jgi:hypothetical protein